MQVGATTVEAVGLVDGIFGGGSRGCVAGEGVLSMQVEFVIIFETGIWVVGGRLRIAETVGVGRSGRGLIVGREEGAFVHRGRRG